MIVEVPDTVYTPTVDDLVILGLRGRPSSIGVVSVAGVVGRAGEHPVSLIPAIGTVAFRLLGEGYVWTCIVTGNGGVVDTRLEALEALLLETLTEFPTTDRRP